MGRMQLRYGPNRAGPVRPSAADRRPREAHPQGELLPGRGGRQPLHHRAVPRRLHGADDVLGDPVGARLGDRRLPGQRLRRRPSDRADPDLRDRLTRDLRLHHRRLGLRLEVLAPRLDAHLRAARLVRGLARALGARRRDDGEARSRSSTSSPPRSVDVWYVIPQIVGFVVFLLAGTAETARAPFDLPEAEQELVAGYHTEYGGMRFGLFSMSEYINLITLSGLAVTLFLGGWHGPWLPGPIWFVHQGLRAALRLHLDAHDAAAAPLRPADALRLEGAAARRRRSTP